MTSPRSFTTFVYLSENMEFFLSSVLLLLFNVFQRLSAEISLHATHLECLKGASWKMIISPTQDIKSPNIPERNFTDIFKFNKAFDEDSHSKRDSIHFLDCPFEVEKNYDENRLPQVMTSVKCQQTRANASKNIRHLKHTQCEEVKLQVPVLRKNSCVELRNNYSLVWETASVAYASPLECLKGALWKINVSRSLDVYSPSVAILHPERTLSGIIKINNEPEAYEAGNHSKRDSIHFLDCPFELEKKYDENRLPQVISSIKCQQMREKGSKNIRHRRHTQCEEVKLQVPVLRKNSCVEGRENYSLVWETASVACIRTVRSSRIRSKTAHKIPFDVPS
ncbi:hypothetical protein HNY73_013413 [Argiope bruennichi]|uniref:Uncharacterized protein n=1 Tax=Argiope bruennichi TaxID=94029 RepID=A0A8T0F2N4_ARGBR|nr:hypothetical protein HNY73_013413 [Argiope bruennichi]